MKGTLDIEDGRGKSSSLASNLELVVLRPVLHVSLASFSAGSAVTFLVTPAVELNHAVKLAKSHIDML